MQPSTINRLFVFLLVSGIAVITFLSLSSEFRETTFESFPLHVTTTASKWPLTFIPAIGLGTWLSKPGEVTDAVGAAIDAGYRHIDTAMIYRNEKEVGKGLEQSGVPRNEIWVTSKLFNNDHHPEDVEPAIRKSLSDLGIEYLDLYLMHWPVALKDGKLDDTVSYVDTWKAMEQLVYKGLTKNIGISNFAQHEVEDILSHATIWPAAHEFETHPYLQQQDFVDWNIRQGIQVIAYSPFGNLNPIYDSGIPSILEDEFWIDLADEKNATVPQTILAWGMQRGTVVIPKSVHAKRIEDNFKSKEIRFTDDDLKKVKGNNKELRLNNPSKNWGYDLFSDLEGKEIKGDM
ncbi:putative aldehyde reductase [Phaeomoniella chlamydospora]|uniref:D-xylose reductase [NAD(P)H] n=1 Tax=Phaeomoniella chlamydospora TaxID=158046 RepID=A0A0G2H1I9_PHACM|nr:putative aldehyde reductase [Phaeomoniella chlamydospora]